MKQSVLTKSLIAAGLIAAAGIGYVEFGSSAARANDQPARIAAAAESPSNAALQRALPDFTQLVEAYGPAVVNIAVTRAEQKADGPQAPQLDPNDPRFEFFRRFQIPMPNGEPAMRGVGSGFIVSQDGYILTNAHVVANADEVTVRLTDRREFVAKVIGADKPTDVAVLKIDAKYHLPTVKLGNPAATKVGEWVVAIGAPFGFENSVTSGIVSAKSRPLPDQNYVAFLQTDVAVNPGSSGGPLLNLNGEVIGMNSQIYSRTGGYQGLSFAIPIDAASKVKDELIAHGHVTRGRLGIAIQDVSQSLADSFGLKEPGGALVSSVERDGAAAKAGVEAGDVILKINGKSIQRSAELPLLVSDIKPGTSATLDIWRKGGARSIAVKMGELKDAVAARADDQSLRKSRLGLALRPLTPEEQAAAGETSGALVVQEVAGPAARAGIRPGDVLVSLNGTPVKSVEQLRELVAKSGKRIALLIERDGAKMFVPVELG